MTIKVTVNSVPKNRVAINDHKRETVRTVGIGASAPGTTLRTLNDVDAVPHLINGYVLVYDSASDHFVLQELPRIEGGSF